MYVVRALERFHTLLGVVAGLSILIITFIVVGDVARRAALGAPIQGATELSTLLMVGLVYLGLASVQEKKANFRVELLISTLSRTRRAFLEAATTLLSIITIGLLTWYTALEAWSSTSHAEMSFGAIIFPVWPARIVIAFGLFTLCVQLVIDFLRLCLGAGPTEAAHEAAEEGRAA